MEFTVIIPARYDSTRLPGKPLQKIHNKTLLEYVYNCAAASAASEIIIATDDERIRQAATSFGADVEMTSREHNSGTQRIAEVIERRGISRQRVIVNLQGDEPLMPADCINQVALLLDRSPEIDMATLSSPFESAAEIMNPHTVKIVTDQNGHALYFSRAPIPWDREHFSSTVDKTELRHYQSHIGLYAYRAAFVLRYASLPASPLEQLEALEQLRVLWHGGTIGVAEAEVIPGPGVDTAEELEAVSRLLI